MPTASGRDTYVRAKLRFERVSPCTALDVAEAVDMDLAKPLQDELSIGTAAVLFSYLAAPLQELASNHLDLTATVDAVLA